MKYLEKDSILIPLKEFTTMLKDSYTKGHQDFKLRQLNDMTTMQITKHIDKQIVELFLKDKT